MYLEQIRKKYLVKFKVTTSTIRRRFASSSSTDQINPADAILPTLRPRGEESLSDMHQCNECQATRCPDFPTFELFTEKPLSTHLHTYNFLKNSKRILDPTSKFKSIQVLKYSSIQVFKYSSIQVLCYSSIQIFQYSSIQVFQYSSNQVFKYSSIQVFKYSSL